MHTLINDSDLKPFSRVALAMIRTAEALGRIFGLDLYIDRDDRLGGFFSFAHVRHDQENRQAWGLGLSVMVSKV